MNAPAPLADLSPQRHIIVADEDPKVVTFIVLLLRQDGHAVFHAYDGLAATELAFVIPHVDLVISNTRVGGMPGIGLIYQLRSRKPDLPILYIANIDRSTPAIEAKLPRDVPILREPFTPEELRRVVRQLLTGTEGLRLDVNR